MPSSGKRSHRGRRAPLQDNILNPINDFSSSPSRLNKRQRRNMPNNATNLRQEPEAQEQTQGSDNDRLVSQVTQHLKYHPIQASKDHANAIHEANGDGVKAYAKVAAHDWTFYITKLAINIGRAPEIIHRKDSEEDGDHVHIDLGPSKMVSRAHAAIFFDSKDEKWLLQVKGRNGAKVDGQALKARVCHSLTSGEVIEIGNVEMMFVLPSEISPLHVHPSFIQRSGLPPELPSKPDPHRRIPNGVALSEQKHTGTSPPALPKNEYLAPRSPDVATTAVMIGASGVDLSQEENQHIKPQYSYAQMITQAILNAPDGKLNLNGIYNFIIGNYSYYRHQQAAGWQNSIRHNLSLNRSFDKVARSTDEPGKGMKWQIVAEAKDEMTRNAYKIGRGGHRGSSAPSSPSQLNYITQGPRDMATKDSPLGRKRRGSPLTSPPPRSSLRLAQSTPRRSRDRSLDRTPSGSAALTGDGSPILRHRKQGPNGSAFSGFNHQSPTLTSSYQHDDSASFVTPAPPRIHPKLAPPSTAQRPSQHMPTSSPAPFWKYADIGSTPLKPAAPYEASPSKTLGDMITQSSSPPTRGKSPPSSPTRPQISGRTELNTKPDADEEGFDLTKGFQSISAYHAPVGNALTTRSSLRSNS